MKMPLAMPGVSTIPEMLRRCAEQEPDRRSFTFLRDDGTDETHITYAELLTRSSGVAAELRARIPAGELALLLYPPGLDYVVAIFGCLLAGVVAVPAYPPSNNRLAERVEGIATDAQPRIVLGTKATLAAGKTSRGLDTIATDTLPRDFDSVACAFVPQNDTVAFLQYTSGSTKKPRGVIVTHGNLLHNFQQIRYGFQLTESDLTVSWLPGYHDMGLIGTILLPPCFGQYAVLMPPSTFLQRPSRWLEAISRYHATIAGCPNFGYDLCVAHTTREEREKLDLSQWRVAFNGAEPIRAETLDNFAQAFSKSGFRKNSFYTCYGMAEATLLVTGSIGSRDPVVQTVKVGEPHSHGTESPKNAERRMRVVGCGYSLLDTTVVIVDPQGGTLCAPGIIGEICVAGPSVARGYWNRPKDTALAFGAHIKGSTEGPFLRTGDLGFLSDGELFVTGRLKDLIIIHGCNYYPQDIEWTVERSHNALASNSGAAFSVDFNGQEGLVILQEVKRSKARHLDWDEVIRAIRDSVAREYDLSPQAVVLTKPLSIPKTSSGKIQRHACREAFLNRVLPVLAQWEWQSRGAQPWESHPRPASVTPSTLEIQRWLTARIASLAGLDEDKVQTDRAFAYYGLTSVQAVIISNELQEWLGRQLSPTLAYDYPTIGSLSQYLASDMTPKSTTATSPEIHASAAEPVAVIGMACRFPKSTNTQHFWQMLCDGVDAIGEVPAERRTVWDFWEQTARQNGGAFPSHGGFLQHVDEFDPEFFGISPREALSLDPQQRLLLEVASEALEDAGQRRETIHGSRTGVFVGISSSDYSRLRFGEPGNIDPYAGTGNALSIAANRISYEFDLRGPSMAVDTACSSSLVAVHLACESLQRRQCSVALAGGVNLVLSPAVTATFAKAGFLAIDGRCKAFDSRANGYVRGEGAGIVVLKLLSRALADGDRVYALIRGSSVNNDGRTNGLTAPSRLGQEGVLREAYARAGVAPHLVSYIEAHGTGTSLGDPIEVEALGNVIAQGRTPGDECLLGSVKTNIGHLEAAAGIAGLIKTVLAIFHGEIPPSLHFKCPNPNIPFDRLPLRVQRSLTKWPSLSRLAGVSSFGFGGTNAHVVLDQAPVPPQTAAKHDDGLGKWRILPLSAASPEALRTLGEQFSEFLAPSNANADTYDWASICHTAGVRRTHYEHRMAVIAQGPAQAASALQAFCRGERSSAVLFGRVAQYQSHRCVFVFSDIGPDWQEIGLELLNESPIFRSAVEECDRILRQHTNSSLLDRIQEGEARFDKLAIAMPILLTLQVGLAVYWQHLGVMPDAVVASGAGEIAAAYITGALSLEDAMRVACQSERLIQQPACPGQLSSEAATIDVPRVDAQLPKTPRAIGLKVPSLPIITEVNPKSNILVAEYLRSHLREVADFPSAVDAALDEGHRVFVEIGPQSALGAAIVTRLRARSESGVVVGSLGGGASASQRVLASLGEMYVQGWPVKWQQLYPMQRPFINLPRHPWRRRRFWINGQRDQENNTNIDIREPAAHRLLGRRIESSVAATHVWENEISRIRQPFLEDHVFQGNELVPGTAYFEIAVAAASEIFGLKPIVLKNISLRNPLFLPHESARQLQVSVSVTGVGEGAFRVFSRPKASSSAQSITDWILHALGEIAVVASDQQPLTISETEIVAIQHRCTQQLTGHEYFAELGNRGFTYGPAFRGLKTLWRRTGEALGEIQIPEVLTREISAYHLHPAIIDAGAQLVVATDGINRPFLPVGVDEVRVHQNAGVPALGHALFKSHTGASAAGFTGDVNLYDANRNLLVEAIGLRVQYLDSAEERIFESSWQRWLYKLNWEPKPLAEEKGHIDTDGIWLILADAGGVGERLAANLVSSGNRYVTVFAGTAFAQIGTDSFRIRTANVDDLLRVIDAVLTSADKKREEVRGVVHLWSLDSISILRADTASLAEANQLGTGTVIALLRALASRKTSAHCPLWLVTRGAQRIEGQRFPVEPAQATLWGLGRTIFNEQPNFAGALIDLDPELEIESAAAFLAREMAASNGETELAVRQSEVYAARLERWREPESLAEMQFRTDASYLISGGLGALGIEITRWMVERGARRIIVLGRTPLPPRSEWMLVKADSHVAEQISAIREVESRGASIHVGSIDVGDEEKLSSFLDGFQREAWPPIRGVIHAAGVVHDEILQLIAPETLESVLRAKVAGGWLLHQCLKSADLDFFVLFSSAASLLGSPGQGAYAAANGFLDGLAYYRRDVNLPAMSINWGPWAAGMAVNSSAGRSLAQRGINSISPPEGLQLFGRLLRSSVTQVAAIPIDWQLLGRSFPNLSRSPVFSNLLEGQRTENLAAANTTEADDATEITKRIMAVNGDERRVLVEEFLSEQVARIAELGVDRVDPHRSLDSFGIDSLMSIELKERLETAFKIVIPLVRLLELPTIAGLTTLMMEQLEAIGDARGTATPVGLQRKPTLRTDVITLCASGTETAFFCVHPGGLDAQCYAGLAQDLGDDTPFYVLQPAITEASQATGDGFPELSIESAATSCVNQLRSIQPEGPYRLGGWSLGGVVAFEVAQQLKSYREEVAPLVLFDAPLPALEKKPTDADDSALFKMFATYFGARRGRQLVLPSDSKTTTLSYESQYLLDRAIANDLLPSGTTIDQLLSLFKTYKEGLRVGTRILQAYHPQTYAGRITYFQPLEELNVLQVNFPDAKARWSYFAESGLDVHKVHGNHYTLFLKPYVSELASLLRSALCNA
jgi:phthiocerol/phenolphthiocerol synthesis type-I polyketide synthase C